jgi:hypothetical protein
MKAETREWRGLTLLSSYTWSKSIDTAQQSRGAGGGSTVFAMNIFDIDLESRGRSNFDVSQLWVNSAIFRLPEPRWAAGKPKSPGGLLLSGWQLNSILTARTGFPITVYSGVDTANVGNGNDTHASTVPGQALISPGATADNWLNRAAFTFGPDCRLASVFATLSSPSQCYGTAGRNIVNAPGLFNLDFSLVKNIAVTDRAGIQFRAEAFNITNTPALGFPANRISNPAFGRILSAGPSRQIQFALRLHF